MLRPYGFCHPVTCHPVTCHPVTLSPGHPVTLSPSHPVSFAHVSTPICSSCTAKSVPLRRGMRSLIA
jgi:hypothetical protein